MVSMTEQGVPVPYKREICSYIDQISVHSGLLVSWRFKPRSVGRMVGKAVRTFRVALTIVTLIRNGNCHSHYLSLRIMRYEVGTLSRKSEPATNQPPFSPSSFYFSIHPNSLPHLKIHIIYVLCVNHWLCRGGGQESIPLDASLDSLVRPYLREERGKKRVGM